MIRSEDHERNTLLIRHSEVPTHAFRLPPFTLHAWRPRRAAGGGKLRTIQQSPGCSRDLPRDSTTPVACCSRGLRCFRRSRRGTDATTGSPQRCEYRNRSTAAQRRMARIRWTDGRIPDVASSVSGGPGGRAAPGSLYCLVCARSTPQSHTQEPESSPPFSPPLGGCLSVGTPGSRPAV